MRTTCSSRTSCTQTWCAPPSAYCAGLVATLSGCVVLISNWRASMRLQSTGACRSCALRAAQHAEPVRGRGAGARQDLGDKTIQCGRRADAFKLWLTWKVRPRATSGRKGDGVS